MNSYLWLKQPIWWWTNQKSTQSHVTCAWRGNAVKLNCDWFKRDLWPDWLTRCTNVSVVSIDCMVGVSFLLGKRTSSVFRRDLSELPNWEEAHSLVICFPHENSEKCIISPYWVTTKSLADYKIYFSILNL